MHKQFISFNVKFADPSGVQIRHLEDEEGNLFPLDSKLTQLSAEGWVYEAEMSAQAGVLVMIFSREENEIISPLGPGGQGSDFTPFISGRRKSKLDED